MADVLREPVYVRPIARAVIAAAVVPNLLFTTLQQKQPVGKAALPGNVTRIQVASWAPPPNLLFTTLQQRQPPGDTKAAAPTNPSTIRKFARTWSDSPNLLVALYAPPPANVVLRDPTFARIDPRKFAGSASLPPNILAGVFGSSPPATTDVPCSTDWQANVYRRYTQAIVDPPNTIQLLSIVVQPPVRPVDLQPQFRRRVVYAEPVPNLAVRGIVAPPVLPFAQYDWPQVYRKPIKYDIQWSNYQLPPRSSAAPPVDGILEIIPYLIGQYEYSARFMLEQIYMSVVVVGSGGTVSAQDIEAFTLQPRYTTVTITMGGENHIPPSRRRGRGNPPYGGWIA